MLKKLSKVCLLKRKDLGEFTLALVIQTLLLPQHGELYITHHLYIKKTLQGLITSAKRPWRVYAHFGYANFVAVSAGGIIYTPPMGY